MENNEYILKEINLSNQDDEALEEAIHMNLGNENKAGICYIKIKGNEGPIPHFHIESKSGKFFCCVKLYEADYFHHIDGEKDLSKDQKEILNENLSVDDWKNLCTAFNNLNVNDKSKKEMFDNYIKGLKKKKADVYYFEKPDYRLIP